MRPRRPFPSATSTTPSTTTSATAGVRVTKARLGEIAKANEKSFYKALYTADSVQAIEAALKMVKGISEARLDAKVADYGEEYYALYDAVRYAKTAENAVADKAAPTLSPP